MTDTKDNFLWYWVMEVCVFHAVYVCLVAVVSVFDICPLMEEVQLQKKTRT
jgi:hypothetical protein